MAVIGPGRSELAEFVADHIFGHDHGEELLTIVNAKGQTDELGQDGGATRPDLDDLVTPACPRLIGFLQQVTVDERPLPDAARHGVTPLLRMTAAQDLAVRLLVVPRLLALGRLAPRGHRMAATGGPAFATTVRVVDRVHGDATDRRTLAQPAVTAGLAQVDVGLVGGRHRADRGEAFAANDTELTRRQLQLGIALVAADELHVGAGRSGQLAALARLQLHIVDDRAHRDVLQRHRVARLHVHALTGDNGVADLQALWRQNVGLLAVLITDQRDERRGFRIVLQPFDNGGGIELATLEVDHTVAALVAAAD